MSLRRAAAALDIRERTHADDDGQARGHAGAGQGQCAAALYAGLGLCRARQAAGGVRPPACRGGPRPRVLRGLEVAGQGPDRAGRAAAGTPGLGAGHGRGAIARRPAGRQRIAGIPAPAGPRDGFRNPCRRGVTRRPSSDLKANVTAAQAVRTPRAGLGAESARIAWRMRCASRQRPARAGCQAARRAGYTVKHALAPASLTCRGRTSCNAPMTSRCDWAL